MMLFSWLKDRNRRKESAAGLYQAALAASRQRDFYNYLYVPDTLDGRFDLVCVHVFLLIDRLMAGKSTDARAMVQPLFDAMFRAIDTDLREQGLDMSVGKHVRRMMKAFNGRARSYTLSITAGQAALETALARNVWRAENTVDVSGAAELAAYVMDAQRRLAAQPLDSICAGTVEFPALTPFIVHEQQPVAAHA